MVRKVLFTFKDNHLEKLLQIQKEGSYTTPMECLGEALRILNGLQEQAKEGYYEIIVRNPRTGEERTVVLDRFMKIADAHMEELTDDFEGPQGPQASDVCL